jgi:Bacterial Ig domain
VARPILPTLMRISPLDLTFFRRSALLAMSVFCVLGGDSAFGQSCVIDGPRYNLTADSVAWSMQIESGRTCLRGVRLNNVEVENLEIASPPQSGKLTLVGSGFAYTAKPDFRGEDSFSLTMIGSINRKRGSSAIKVTVFVGLPKSPTPASPSGSAIRLSSDKPPSISFTEPLDGATVSGAAVRLMATASGTVAIAQVQFIVDGKNIGPVVVVPPYAAAWNTNEATDGFHRVYAVAKDEAGNYGTSSITVNIRNRIP